MLVWLLEKSDINCNKNVQKSQMLIKDTIDAKRSCL